MTSSRPPQAKKSGKKTTGETSNGKRTPTDGAPKTDRLEHYRRRRDPSITPEPVPARAPRRHHRVDGDVAVAAGRRFVIQEHHARALHWDFRLERDGVLVSWAIPKGLPVDKKTNHLAVHTEDHPMEYATFEGTIPAGEYGGGKVILWDFGTYDEIKWSDREVMVVLHGERVQGSTCSSPPRGRGGPGQGQAGTASARGRNWMVHRMDDAPAGYEPLPHEIRPMLATPGTLPKDDDGLGLRVQMGRHPGHRLCGRGAHPDQVAQRQRRDAPPFPSYGPWASNSGRTRS